MEDKTQNKNNKGFLRFVTDNSVKIAIGLVTLILISLMLPSYKSIETEYEVGTVWSNEDLIAPFSFPIYRDDKEYDAEKNEIIKNLAPVYNKLNNQPNITPALDSLFYNIEQVLNAGKTLEANNDGDILSPALQTLKSQLTIDFSNEEWKSLYALYKDNAAQYNIYKNSIINTLSDLSKNDIIDTEKAKITSGRISIESIADNRTQDIKDLNGVYDEKEIRNIIRQRIKEINANEDLALTGEEIAKVYLQPNLLFNKELTDVELNNRIERIPKTIGIVRENERIISKHDPITRQTKLKLDSYKTIRLERIGVQDYFRQYIGKFFMVLILLIIYALFLYFIRNKIFRDNLRLALISSLILLECFFAFISLKITVSAPVELLIFVSVASIMLTILFDSRLSFFTTVIICFLVAAIRGGDYTIAFISFCASVLAIFSVRDIKNRSQIFRSFFFILLGYSLSILAIGFDRTEDTNKVLMELLFGGINAVMSPVIAYGLLIFYEKVFKITTDLTLVELSDFNHPLLKELSSKAPGTFHHSIIMGNLSEEASQAIGANRILARVGCYYHDIGKTVEPEFFIENQIDKINKHDKLQPTTSAQIIIAHVQQGMDLARKYKLPEVLIDFIPMHHGTTLVSYFYNKAQDQENIFPDGNKEEYRYPGPKPQTKETGIVMLADSIEAATRTLEDPTPEKLEKKIIEIIRTRFMEGELDECELTLRDLTKIKNSFLKILIGIHHHRVKYPDKKKELEPENVSSEDS
ncbi:MAG TPA: HDIG domain-containing protein [Ignavibacteria bacterium]|nr:HDIG domain-containing protein [Ignavibacteria bacterium]